MARRKLKDNDIRKIQNSKGSYYVTIPITVMKELGWRERQKVRVKRVGTSKIVITDWEK